MISQSPQLEVMTADVNGIPNILEPANFIQASHSSYWLQQTYL